jgi:calcineurin-like phosphoesterase family protein
MWNSVVKPGDYVYHGGDFGDPSCLHYLHGHIRMLMGNHDDKPAELLGRVKKLMLWRRWDIEGVKFVHTHIPIHMSADQVPGKRLYQFNVHGHIHEKIVQQVGHQPDLRYMNVCVEQLEYTPIHIEDVVKELKRRQKLLAPYEHEA